MSPLEGVVRLDDSIENRQQNEPLVDRALAELCQKRKILIIYREYHLN